MCPLCVLKHVLQSNIIFASVSPPLSSCVNFLVSGSIPRNEQSRSLNTEHSKSSGFPRLQMTVSPSWHRLRAWRTCLVPHQWVFFFFRFPFGVGRLRECWLSFKGPVQASSSLYIASRPHLLLSGDHQHSGHRAHKTSEPGPAILLLSLLPPGCFIASSCLTHLHIPTTKLLLCPPSSFLFRAYFYLPIYSCYFIFGHTGSSLLVNSRLAFP